MFERIDKISGIIKNLSIACFFIYSVIFLVNINKTLDSIAKDFNQTHSKLLTEISLVRQDFTKTTNTALSKIDNRIISIEKNLFSRIENIESKTFASVEKLNTNLDRITDESIALSRDYRTIPRDFTNTITPINERMNCVYNDSCWPNLFTDVLIDTRNMARSGSNSFLTFNKEVPKITNEINKVSTSFANGVPVILDNVTKITNNIDRLTKPKWYDRILGIGANATLVYYNVTRR
jgi:uncharacterized protein YoxC